MRPIARTTLLGVIASAALALGTLPVAASPRAERQDSLELAPAGNPGQQNPCQAQLFADLTQCKELKSWVGSNAAYHACVSGARVAQEACVHRQSLGNGN